MKNRIPSHSIRYSGLIFLMVFGWLAASASHLAASDSGKSSEWPRWRGQNMDATVLNSGIFGDTENYRLETVWKKRLGTGYSSVSVAEGLSVTMFSDGQDDYSIALNAETGNELWRYKIDSTFTGRYGSQNGPISTVVIGERSVFGLGPRGHLFALDLKTGNEKWRNDLVNDYKSELPFYGFSSAPILYNNLLILQSGGTEQNSIIAFDSDNGQLVWHTGSDQVNYQSPVLLKLNGTEQILAIGQKYFYGLAAEDGKTVWEFTHNGQGRALGVGSANPVILPDNQFFLTKHHNESTLLQIVFTGDSTHVEEKWKTKGLKRSYTVPVYWDGYLYGYNNTFFACIDAATGKNIWKSRKPGDGFPIVVDGHLVVLTKKGKLSIAKASPEGYTEIAGIELFEDIAWSLPAVAYNKIYVRSHGEIACVKVIPGNQTADASTPEKGIVTGSEFAMFVKKVTVAEDKKSMIDNFMALQKEFPIIEGNDIAHIVYRGEANEMALTGELVGMETEQNMNQVPGTDLFYYSVRLKPDTRIGYGFIKDLQEHLLDPKNPHKVKLMWWGELSELTMPEWKKSEHLSVNTTTPEKRIIDVILESERLEKTDTLRVYLPRDYESSTKRYPVVYHHSIIGNSHIPASLDYLIGNSVQPVIVVFIPPFSRGGYGTYIGDFRNTYADVFIQDVIPLIEEKFRTLNDAKNRANSGAFWGGYMAFYTTLRNPGMFGKLAMQSPYWDPEVEKQHDSLTGLDSNLQIYLDWGKYDAKAPLEGWDFTAYSRSFSQLLKKNGHPYKGGEFNEGSGWLNWANRTNEVYESLFPLNHIDQ